MSSFRPMRRAKQALTEDEIREVLRSAKRGVLSVTGDNGWPYGVYVNPFYDEDTGRLYFHGGKVGHKVDALRRDPRACFTAIDEGTHDASRPPAWALTFRSVVVFGRIRVVEEEEKKREICTRLCRKFTDDEDYLRRELTQALPRVQCLELTVDHMTGKLVNES